MNQTKLNIEFDGHNYHGWQIQKNTSLTIQEKLNNALFKMYKSEVQTTASGRTDAKVHALNLSVVYTPPFEIANESLLKGLNSYLPEDIRVKTVENVSGVLRPTHDAISREYRYLFTNNDIQTAFQAPYIINTTHKLDFDKMKLAASCFEGEHDFKSFHCKGSDPTTTVRKIYSFELCFCEVDMHGIFPSHYYFKIRGNGFLKQMVRMMVGAIFDVGRGKLEVDDIKRALRDADGQHMAPVAPPEGLYKYSVEY